MSAPARLALGVVLACVLQACGGGDSSGSPPPTSQEPPPTTDPDPVPTDPADGVATLTWMAPTTNEDGSALTDLAGFRIYYGTSPQLLSATIEIDDPTVAGYTVTGLTHKTWYFAVSAIAANQTESGYTLVASTTIQ